jgi:hypothetical protein
MGEISATVLLFTLYLLYYTINYEGNKGEIKVG